MCKDIDDVISGDMFAPSNCSHKKYIFESSSQIVVTFSETLI